MKKIKCFTLAEVLITLSILGVVAAILIPNTIQKITDRQTVTALKKAYATIDHVLELAQVIEGKETTWTYPSASNWDKKENKIFLNDKLSKYLNYKSVGTITHIYKNISGQKSLLSFGKDYEGRISYIIETKDGMYISFIATRPNNKTKTYAATDTHFGAVEIDINGKRGPNKLGYDIFKFPIGENGIIIHKPTWYIGSRDNDYYSYYVPANCNFFKPSSSQFDGLSCGYWIMRHNNMDYKYRDVSNEWW